MTVRSSALVATDDLERARHDVDEHGYCLIAGALSSLEVAMLRQTLVDAAYDDVDAGEGFIDSGGSNQRVWALLGRDQVFCDLTTHAVALEMMAHVLGRHNHSWPAGDELPHILLSSITANIAGPGGDPMALHADQGYVTPPWPDFPLVANVAWMLDDFTADNGATRVVPGSHRFNANPSPNDDVTSISAEGAAGTALVFDGRLWHGTGRNVTTSSKRHGILAYYCQPWMRTQENHLLSTDATIVARASPSLRRLIGLDRYASLGMINGLPAGLTGQSPARHHHRVGLTR